MKYFPLYIRSEYSILNSLCRIDSLVDKAVSDGMNALPITDKGTMYGTIKFYNACKNHNLKPVIGLWVPYLVNEVPSVILLYAVDNFGYTSLMKISSNYKINGKALDIIDLKRLAKNCIAVTCGNESILYDFARQNNVEKAKEHYNILADAFEKVYIGISLTTTEDKKHYDFLYDFMHNLTDNLVAVQPTYYLNFDDSQAYAAIRGIEKGGELVQLSESDANSYYLNSDEMEIMFGNHPDLITRTLEIADACNVEIKLGEIQIPRYDEKIDAKQYLYELALYGLKKRLSSMMNPNINYYMDRFKMEYDVICKMGFADYFLIVWDYVRYAKKNDILVGPGRGSGGASLIAYSLGITDVDPLKYNLLFERFLNIERISMPDIDIDFPDDRRSDVIKYVGSKYGKGHVAHISTFGTFQIKLAINDCARVFKTNEDHLKVVQKYIKSYLSGENQNDFVADPDEEAEEVDIKNLQSIINDSAELKQLMDENEDINLLLTTAVKIQGLPRNISTHAAGMIITKNDLINYTALANGLDDVYQTQLPAGDLESLGLLKMDFLGLKNLSNIKRTIDYIKADNPSFVMPKEENDRNVYKMLSSGDVVGVFQLESKGMKKVIVNLNTSSFNDIVSALALYRPGPMDIIPNYIDRKFGREKINYPHPDLANILKETYGMILYQEQIMQIAVRFAGYSLGRADILRRAVSKKKKDVLEKERNNFVESSVKCGYTKDVADYIYDYIEKFASYGFNKAHSVAYGKIAYQTAFLKCYFPVYYMGTLMTNFLGDVESIKDYTKELLRKGIKVYPPDINESTNEFRCFNGGILFPLNAVKGLGSVKALDIMKERSYGKFESFKDFVIRTRNVTPISVVYSLIYASAFDQFGLTKKTMVENAKKHIELLDYEDMPGIIGVKYTDEEFPYGELMQLENHVFGFNIKYSFMNQYRNLYIERHLQYIKDAKVGNTIRTLGMVKSIKEIKTKKGDNMAFVTIEDDNAQIDVTVFPKVLERNPGIKNGIIVTVVGKVDMRNQLQIVADDIYII